MNKNILVTGCSRGLGLEVCRVLLLRGYNVYGISSKSNNKLNELLNQFPNQMKYLAFDLSNTSLVANTVFKQWLSNSIPIHGFVNNAAIAYDDIITNLALDKLEQMFAVNVFTPYLFVKNVIRNAIFNKVNTSIVHLSSISVHTGYKGLSMYAGSKGALEAFSKNTAREWGEKGIRSNCVVAGFMETDMSSNLSQDQKDRIYKRNSLKSPTDINSVAEMIVHLISEKSVAITGQNIFVDSGTI